jgi:hypothetical protein
VQGWESLEKQVGMLQQQLLPVQIQVHQQGVLLPVG